MGKVRTVTQRQMHTIHVHTHSSTFPLLPLASRHRSTSIPALDHGLVNCGNSKHATRSTSLPQLMSWVLTDGREPRSQAEAHTPSPGPPPPGFALLLLPRLRSQSEPLQWFDRFDARSVHHRVGPA
ncbi:hypothetical protein JMJ77_0008633 [Colletotrichum scovillei]|uniref:Uncharacterized protein n=1 Tax=Colletotrichum scovillei TaxID=1209932 RepID=A0A9P7UH54_9PEZI|nr:hypothetical protein JMJ77_0008633 [Colletotrichum scovillei]KAG7075666.1 hypothetical protein JMJ76_0012123 [Colletotrichum scovillei]KAG7082781.1 hypothetical protein JMJ78_0004879 [Colletotrichum scovillei]